MKYRKVRLIQEEISLLGLGCWGFSGPSVWDGCEDQKSIATIHKALDIGVNFFDVAPIYGNGHAEEVLGKGIKGSDRSRMLIATKCGLPWNDQGEARNDLSAASILKEIEDSLRRLNTDYVDLYQLHWPDPGTPLEETLEVITRIREAGKIRYFGVSNFSRRDTEWLMERERVVSYQGLYNMLERNPSTYHTIDLVYRTEKDILPLCREQGMAFFPYSPLFQGLLSGAFKEEGNFSATDVRSFNPKLNGDRYRKYYNTMKKVQSVAEEFGRPLNEVAVNWLGANEAVTSVIGTCQTPGEVEANARALEWELDAEMKSQVDRILTAVGEE